MSLVHARTHRRKAVAARQLSTTAVAGLTGASWTIVMLMRLFVGGTIGMGDNGDSRRLMCQLGVRVARPWQADVSKYVYTTWVSHRWYGEACGADGSGEPYRSSQLWLLRLAKPVTRLFGFPGALDLRALGVISAVVVGLVTFALVLLLPGRLRLRIGIASLIGLAVADSAVAEYFISPYSEPAGLLGILALCAALLWLWRSGKATWPRLMLVAGLGTFVMTSKSQAVAFLPVIMLAMLWLPHQGLDDAGSWFRLPFGRRGVRWLLSRWPALVACAVMVFVSVSYLGAAPKRFQQMGMYKQVFMEILPHSRTPAADLKALGVDPALASSNGADINDPRAAATLPQYLQFRDKVTQTKVVKFYLTHPDRVFAVASDGLRAMSHFREDYLGTYTPTSGQPPGTRECRLCFYTGVFNVAGHMPMLIVGLWFFTFLAGLRVLRESVLDHTERAIGRLGVILAGAAVCEFWAVMLSEGRSDTVKHMIFTNLLSALCIPTLVLCVALLWSANARGVAAAPAVVVEEPSDARDPWLDLIVWDQIEDVPEVPETWAEVARDDVQAERASGYGIGRGGS
jgi:hypothetical protein